MQVDSMLTQGPAFSVQSGLVGNDDDDEAGVLTMLLLLLPEVDVLLPPLGLVVTSGFVFESCTIP